MGLRLTGKHPEKKVDLDEPGTRIQAYPSSSMLNRVKVLMCVAVMIATPAAHHCHFSHHQRSMSETLSLNDAHPSNEFEIITSD